MSCTLQSGTVDLDPHNVGLRILQGDAIAPFLRLPTGLSLASEAEAVGGWRWLTAVVDPSV